MRAFCVPDVLAGSGLWTPDEFAGRMLAPPEFYPVQLCHLNSSYLIENKRPASILPGTKLTIRRGIVTLRESVSLDDRRALLHHPTNRSLIATPQIRNVPNSFRISEGIGNNILDTQRLLMYALSMKTHIQLPKTLQEAVAFFSNPQRTFDYAVALRWQGKKVTCPRCGSTEHSFISTRRIWFCKGCKKQFTVKVGTIFEDSALGMDKWMTAVWLIVNCKNGISSHEVGRALGVTQKSAWFMLHRIRLAMKTSAFLSKLGGEGKEIEADETFIGGAARFMHKAKRELVITARGSKDKAAAFGILERGGEVRTFAVPNRRKRSLQTEIRRHVTPNSFLCTDALLSYWGLRPDYAHEVIDHARSYVRGRVHTNGLENFWSLLKRGIKGTYVSIEPFHLSRYLDEATFRYNNRRLPMGDAGRFVIAMSHVFGRRLTYAQLTGKDTDSLHQ